MFGLEQPLQPQQNLAFNLTEMTRANTSFANTVYAGRQQLTLMALNEHGIRHSTCTNADQLLYVVVGRIGVLLGDQPDQFYELEPGHCIHIPAGTSFRVTTSPHPNHMGGVDYAKIWVCYSSPVYFQDDMNATTAAGIYASVQSRVIVGAKSTQNKQSKRVEPKAAPQLAVTLATTATSMIGGRDGSIDAEEKIRGDDIVKTKVMNGNQEWLKIMQQQKGGGNSGRVMKYK